MRYNREVLLSFLDRAPTKIECRSPRDARNLRMALYRLVRRGAKWHQLEFVISGANLLIRRRESGILSVDYGAAHDN